MCLMAPHTNTVSYPTTTPLLKSPKQKKVGNYSEASIINKITKQTWKTINPKIKIVFTDKNHFNN